MRKTTALAQIPLVKSYLDRLSYIIFNPAKRLESAVFFWPGGNARRFHLLGLITNHALKGYMILHHDFGELDCQDFLAFKAQLINKFDKTKNLSQSITNLIKTQRLLFIVDRLDKLDGLEQDKVFDLLQKIISLDKSKIIVSFHAGYSKNIIEFKKRCGTIPTLCQEFEIPLLSYKEMADIISKTAYNSGLKLNPAKIIQIQSLCGPHIVLARAIIRAILINPNLESNIMAAKNSPGFQLKLSAFISRLPHKYQVELAKKLTYAKSTEIATNNLEFLTQKEKLMFQELTHNKHLDRDRIAQIIWQEKSFELYSDWAIDKAVSRLRKKLLKNGYAPETIKTIKGKGYKYESL